MSYYKSIIMLITIMITVDNTFKNDSKKDTCTSTNKYIQKAKKICFLTVCIMLNDYLVWAKQ